MSPIVDISAIRAQEFLALAAAEQAPAGSTTAPATQQTSSSTAPAGKEGGAKDQPAGGGGGGQQMIMLMVLMGFFLWFIVLRPQKKEKQERQKKLESIKKGDHVITIGGIHGKVAELHPSQNAVSVEVCPKTVIKFSKMAIQTVNPKGSDKPETSDLSKSDQSANK
jgi:preprotein translocase subunit YajC